MATNDMSFEIRTADGETRTFDSFERAITAIAPLCQHCSSLIVGHGLDAEGSISGRPPR